MKREQIEAVLGRKVTDAEWFVACALLELIERHPDAEAVVDRCIERGLSVEETLKQLSKLPPPAPCL
jgi:hypothetical protein